MTEALQLRGNERVLEVGTGSGYQTAILCELARLVSPYPSLADAVGNTASLYYQDVAGGWLGRVGRRIAAWSQ